MIAGNPDHRDDASLKIHQNIPPGIGTSPLHNAWCLQWRTLLVTSFPGPGPGLSITLVMTRLCIM